MTETREDLLEVADRLISELEAHPDPEVAEKVTTLLSAIDAVHRTGLTHLVGAIESMAGEAFIHRLCADPAVRLLLMSYDLVAVGRRLQTEEAVDAVRGHLHAHGVDVEVKDVVGGVVYVRLHVRPGPEPDLDAAARDLEAALREGLPGFQQLVVRDREPQVSQLVQLGRSRRPVYVTVAEAGAIPAGALVAADAEGQPVLLTRVDGEVYAFRNRCGESPLPLQYSELMGSELRCSWHGCRYDVRTGARLEGEGEALAVYPVREEDGAVQIAVATEPAAQGSA